MGLVPIYVFEKEGKQLPDNENYFVIAKNGLFMHNDAGLVKGVVRIGTTLDKLPGLADLPDEQEKPLPVYIYDAEDTPELPVDQSYYVVAKNGIFLHRPGDIKRFTPVSLDEMKFLGNLTPKVRLRLPKLPMEIIFRALSFFRRVWKKFQSEAAVILYYNAEQGEYYLRCPRQYVSGSSVKYAPPGAGGEDPDEVAFTSDMRKKGFAKVGTIHSHCNFNAYHSGIDTADEAKFDGVHVTIGHVDSKTFSLASSIVVNDNRFQVDPETIVVGLRSQLFSRYGFDMTPAQEEKLAAKYKAEIEKKWLPKVSREYALKQHTYDKRYNNTYRAGAWGNYWEDDDESDPVVTHVSAVVQPEPEPEAVIDLADEEQQDGKDTPDEKETKN